MVLSWKGIRLPHFFLLPFCRNTFHPSFWKYFNGQSFQKLWKLCSCIKKRIHEQKYTLTSQQHKHRMATFQLSTGSVWKIYISDYVTSVIVSLPYLIWLLFTILLSFKQAKFRLVLQPKKNCEYKWQFANKDWILNTPRRHQQLLDLL